MLRSFRVENHKSIKDEAELLLMPVYDKSRPVVPVTAIFGANAAGKSNVLDALRWMRQAVIDSFRLWEPERGVPRANCYSSTVSPGSRLPRKNRPTGPWRGCAS
jgi:predicted ATPase